MPVPYVCTTAYYDCLRTLFCVLAAAAAPCLVLEWPRFVPDLFALLTFLSSLMYDLRLVFEPTRAPDPFPESFVLFWM